MAFTKTFAMAAATVLSVTLVPILCSFWMRGPYRSEGIIGSCGACSMGMGPY